MVYHFTGGDGRTYPAWREGGGPADGADATWIEGVGKSPAEERPGGSAAGQAKVPEVTRADKGRAALDEALVDQHVKELTQRFKAGGAFSYCLENGVSALVALLKIQREAESFEERINALMTLSLSVAVMSEDDCESAGVFTEILKALRSIKDFENLPHGETRDHFRMLIEVLGETKRKEMLPDLLDIVRRLPLDRRDACAAVEAIFKTRDSDAIKRLLPMMEREMDSFAADSFIEGLGKWGDPAAIPVLERALGDDTFKQERVILALGELRAGSAVPKIADHLADGKLRRTTSAALAALGRIGGDEASRALRLFADRMESEAETDPDKAAIRLAALGELVRLGDGRAAGELLELLETLPAAESLKRYDVIQILKNVTGQDFDDDVRKWREFFEEKDK